MARTRVSRKLDVQRMGAAVARPGIDTRVWLEFGFVQAFTVDATGAYADVATETGDTITCFAGQPYAGQGYGAFFPLAVDDMVLIAIPSGEPDNGGVIISRLWCNSDTPPAEAVASANDLVNRIKAGQKMRHIVTPVGGRDIFMELNPTQGLVVNYDVTLQHLLSSQSVNQGTGLQAPPVSSDPTHLSIDPTSTDKEGAFTLALTDSPPHDKSIGITVTYNRPYPNGSRVWLQAASDDAAKLLAAANAGSSGTDQIITNVYVSASDKNGFTVQNRCGAGTIGPAITGTFNYEVVGR
jgi:hypothetical protein